MSEYLSKAELETIIRFDETNEPAEIYTNNKSWMRHCEEILGLKPEKTNFPRGKTYLLPKKWLKKPRKPKKRTAAQVEAFKKMQAKCPIQKKPS